MLDNLFNLVKSLAGNSVINNPDIPNEHNDAVIADATHTVASGLQNEVASGGLQNILSLFSQNGQQAGGGTSIVTSMVENFAGNLMSKYGLGSTQASSVANSLIPSVVNSLINKTNDPNNNNFSLDGLLHSLTGGQSTQIAQQQQAAGNSGFSFQNLISQFTGGSSNGGGGLMDIVSKIAGGAQNQQQQQGSGGLMNLITSFIK